MAAGLGGATSGCLCSPLGRSGCTNKPTPGLRSNGNQTCSRTKSPLSPSLLFFSRPLCMTKAPPTHTPAEGRTSIIPNRPENIPPSLYRVFPHSDGSRRSSSLHQRWPSWPRSSQTPATCTYLHRHTFSHFHMLSLITPTLFPLSFHSSIYHTCAPKAFHWLMSIPLTYVLIQIFFSLWPSFIWQ